MMISIYSTSAPVGAAEVSDLSDLSSGSCFMFPGFNGNSTGIIIYVIYIYIIKLYYISSMYIILQYSIPYLYIRIYIYIYI